MLAAYTVGDAIWAIVLLVVFLAFLGAGIWLLIHLFRNKNFIPDHRGLRIVVKVLLVVFTVFLPLLGLPLLLGIWFFTRPRGDEVVEASTPRAVEPKESRLPPFPPPSAPKDA